MSRPKALDLFCGAGGASRGLHDAGYEVIGVDKVDQPNYPYEFYEMDAIEFFLELYDLTPFDLIWASPPCQAHSWGGAQWRNKGYEYEDFITATRSSLNHSNVSYIIENVVGAPLIEPVVLCGTMFPNLKVFRHRLFESNMNLKVEMKCAHEGHKAKNRRTDNNDYFTVAGHNTGTTAEWSDAMGIDWMTKKELAQAIPPVYSKYLAEQIIENSNNNTS